MPDAIPFCPAYTRIEAASIACGRPLIVPEVVRLIESDPATAAEFRRINAALGAGAVITDEQIAERVAMPLRFVHFARIRALRSSAHPTDNRESSTPTTGTERPEATEMHDPKPRNSTAGVTRFGEFRLK